MTVNKDVSIRPMSLLDQASMEQLFADKRIYTNFGQGPLSVDEVRASVRRNVEKWKIGLLGAHVICYREKVVGKLILFPNANQEHELGYVVHPDYWGKGVGSEAARLGIKYLADNNITKIVVAYSRKSNFPSIAILNALGFERIGEEEVDGDVVLQKFILVIAK
ncbi:MAG: GNAT family N-acetyltransferase [Gammaproteobacteria bacterium]|nr:GNAT family N-acetyltransferase [Gammaproteobacteria bacterium]